MQNTKSNPNLQNFASKSTINSFLNYFKVSKYLHEAGIGKLRGYSVREVLLPIFTLPFRKKNFYQGIVNDPDVGFEKSVAYALLNNARYNWRKFLLGIVSAVIRIFMKPLTDTSRDAVLIIDDTSYERNRSKKVELLARVFNHVTHLYFRGFRIMQMGWSDGNSFLPVDFALLSSEKKSNRYMEANEKIDKRSSGGKRRKEAVTKSTNLIVPMIKRAFSAGIKAKYLLMDSWYGLPAIISAAKEYIEVICMVKKTSKIHYYMDGKAMHIRQIYKFFKKNRGRAAIKASYIAQVKSENGFIDVKLVFVKNRSKKGDWLAILSTDTSISDEEVVRLYGRRWDIEVFFKMAKSHLNLIGEIGTRSFDAMITHISIVLLRYIFLAVEQRKCADGKTFGGVFRQEIEEMEDLTLVNALVRLLTDAFEKLKASLQNTSCFIDELMDTLMGIVIQKFELLPIFR